MSYQLNAYHYLRALFEYVEDWNSWDNIIEATEKTFWNTGKNATVTCGSSRLVVVGKDFVIKWDYSEKAVQEIGGCKEEFMIYQKSLSTGYSHLLAPIYCIYYRKRFFYIMPKISKIGIKEHEYKSIDAFVTNKEMEWLKKNIGDLHSYNWGLNENNKPIIIDYACPPSWNG